MRGFVLTVLVLMMDVTSGQISIQPIPQYPVVNGSVTLSVTGITQTVVSFIWYKGPKADPQYQILAYSPGGSPISTPEPLNNVGFRAFSNGSLQIKDLNITDEGNYTVKIRTSSSLETVTVSLTVYEPITQPKIIPSTFQSKENDRFTLTCDSTQAMVIRWMKNGTNFTSKTKSSGDNKALTFSSIRRKDSGQYQCEAQNLVSTSTSDPYTVTVAYGPDMVHIEGPVFVTLGSPITLSCSADSVPPPEYQWKVNGTVLKEENNKFKINNTMIENQGLYTCAARNPVTLRTATDSVYVNVTAELLTNKTWTIREFIIGPALVLVAASSIFGSFFLYRKCWRRSGKESTEKTQEENPVYENVFDKVMAEQPKEESSYMGLNFKSEDTYAEMKA
ncbi:cell adhesion molecule CEACAM8-like [Phyllobates terribilis]|uniref:cell adhesion molecule CEACAM8-like n=1 Tax=Phyllobates terribilis TaxID=111132 RepID=UPI003CCAAA99